MTSETTEIKRDLTPADALAGARGQGLARVAENARDAWAREAVPVDPDRRHRVQIELLTPGSHTKAADISVIQGGDELVAAALRAYADRICPVKATFTGHRPTRGV